MIPDRLGFRLGCALIELYPQAYRQRYGAELRAVLEQYPVTIGTLVDLVVGALDAHVWPGDLRASPARRMRGTVSATAALWIALTLVGAGFAKTTEDVPFRLAAAAHPALADARLAVVVLAAVGAGIVLVAGLPLGLSVLWQAWTGRSRALRRAVAAPIGALVCFAAATAVLVLVAGGSPGPSSVGGRLAFILWLAIAVAVAGVCALGLRSAVQNARLSPATLALAAAGAWLLARVMAALTIAVGLYAVLLTVYSGALQGMANGPFGLSTSVDLALQGSMMAVISALAIVTARRGLRPAPAGS